MTTSALACIGTDGWTQPHAAIDFAAQNDHMDAMIEYSSSSGIVGGATGVAEW